jgi:hypothetical protein
LDSSILLSDKPLGNEQWAGMKNLVMNCIVPIKNLLTSLLFSRVHAIQIHSPSENRTVVGFGIQSYATTGHLKIGPFENRTKKFSFRRVSLDRFIKKRFIKNILFTTKRSRLAEEKSPVQFSNDKNKMADIIWQPSCFDHTKTGQKKSGFQMFGTSLDRFIRKIVIKIFFFIIKRSRLAVITTI